MRKNLYDILQEQDFNLKEEYTRLYELFFDSSPEFKGVFDDSLNHIVKEKFLKLDRNLIGRCTSLEDFNHTHKFNWSKSPQNFSLDYFLTFCEYVYNLIIQVDSFCDSRDKVRVERFISNILECVDLLGYEEIINEEISIFVEKRPEALAVAEIVESTLAYKVMEYNHHKMKGDLESKLSSLKMMADDIESERKKLQEINNTLANQLFQLLNKFVRHTQSATPYINTMAPDELEDCYD
ncbi:MAG: hypothetical protein ACLUKQ_03415, partial [Peptococcaceae bacterium]